MLQTISFPGLGIGEFTLNRVAFTLFGHDIMWYGIIIATAFLTAFVYILRRCPAFGLDSERAFDVLMAVMICGVIGARLYYVIFSWDNYRGDFWSIFKIWEGGLAIYGGIIAGFLAGFYFSKKYKVRFLPLADAAVGGVILAQAIGRWGNFVNVEAFGTNTALPWGMAGESIARYLTEHQSALAAQGIVVDPALPVHPTFFYESMWCLLGFGILAAFIRHRTFDGEITLLYFAWYGAGRSVIEGLRTDSLMLGKIRISQILAIALVIVSVVLICIVRANIRKSKKPSADWLYVYSDEGRANVQNAALRKAGGKKNTQTDDERPDGTAPTAGQTIQDQAAEEAAHEIDESDEEDNRNEGKAD